MAIDKDRIPRDPPSEHGVIEPGPAVIEHELAFGVGESAIDGEVGPALEHEGVVHVAEGLGHGGAGGLRGMRQSYGACVAKAR